MFYFCVQKLENESLIFVRDLEKESLLRENNNNKMVVLIVVCLGEL